MTPVFTILVRQILERLEIFVNYMKNITKE